MHASWMTVSETAVDFSVSTRRVRQMLVEGELDGQRTSAGDWLIDPRVVAATKLIVRKSGRPLAPRTAWAVIAELGGHKIEVDAQTARRAREQIRRSGADDLVRTTMRRSPVHRYSAVAEGFDRDMRRIAVRTGRSAIGVLSGSLRDRDDVFDGYVRTENLAEASKLLTPDRSGTITLLESPTEIFHDDTEAVLALPITAAFDLATLATATRERSLALHYIDRSRDQWLKLHDD